MEELLLVQGFGEGNHLYEDIIVRYALQSFREIDCLELFYILPKVKLLNPNKQQ